jgi:uncharacterized membrane protein YkgB
VLVKREASTKKYKELARTLKDKLTRTEADFQEERLNKMIYASAYLVMTIVIIIRIIRIIRIRRRILGIILGIKILNMLMPVTRIGLHI